MLTAVTQHKSFLVVHAVGMPYVLLLGTPTPVRVLRTTMVHCVNRVLLVRSVREVNVSAAVVVKQQ